MARKVRARPQGGAGGIPFGCRTERAVRREGSITALTVTCKKCGFEAAPGTHCPCCGAKLPAALHAAWTTRRHRPVLDWMCWNAVMRILLPVWTVAMLMILVPEFVSGGSGALAAMLGGSAVRVMLILLAAAAVLTFLVLLLQGEDTIDYAVDGKGIHITHYLPRATPFRLLVYFRSPALMNTADTSSGSPVVVLGTYDLAWKQISRVQFWQEKMMLILYAPRRWMRAYLLIDPLIWPDVLTFLQSKLGTKKGILPTELAPPPRTRADRRGSGRAPAPRPELPEADSFPPPETCPQEALPAYGTLAGETFSAPQDGAPDAAAAPEDPPAQP